MYESHIVIRQKLRKVMGKNGWSSRFPFKLNIIAPQQEERQRAQHEKQIVIIQFIELISDIFCLIFSPLNHAVFSFSMLKPYLYLYFCLYVFFHLPFLFIWRVGFSLIIRVYGFKYHLTMYLQQIAIWYLIHTDVLMCGYSMRSTNKLQVTQHGLCIIAPFRCGTDIVPNHNQNGSKTNNNNHTNSKNPIKRK